MKCDKCGNEDAILLTRQNPKGEKGIFWCEKCTGHDFVSTSDALIEALDPKLIVKFTGQGGYAFEQVAAKKVLELNKTYEVDMVCIERFVTYLSLKGLSGFGRFNSCLFEDNKVLDAIIQGGKAPDGVIVRGIGQKFKREVKAELLNQIINLKKENRKISAIFKDIQQREKLSTETYEGEFVSSNRFNSRLEQLNWIKKNSRKMLENGKLMYALRDKIKRV